MYPIKYLTFVNRALAPPEMKFCSSTPTEVIPSEILDPLKISEIQIRAPSRSALNALEYPIDSSFKRFKSFLKVKRQRKFLINHFKSIQTVTFNEIDAVIVFARPPKNT